MGRSNEQGFSLIELIVVIAIIATLVVIAMPRYQGTVDNAELVALKSNLHVLRESIDRYNEDRAEYPGALQDLVEQRYLRAIPIDPITDSAQTWVVLEESINDRTGIVDVRSGAKGATTNGVIYADL